MRSRVEDLLAGGREEVLPDILLDRRDGLLYEGTISLRVAPPGDREDGASPSRSRRCSRGQRPLDVTIRKGWEGAAGE